MDVTIESTWKSVLKDEFDKEYFNKLTAFVRDEYSKATIYPPAGLIFNAFNLCPFSNIKAVILGQDPYHGPGQAHGLCFSVRDGIDFPPSLLNIFKEIEIDLGIVRPSSGNLERWSRQGVLMLNATLTVREHLAGSHQKKGWEQFTDAVISKINEEKNNVVFMLWGAYAQKKGEAIDRNRHLVLESVHPSPLSASRGFFRNSHFSKCNKYLADNGIQPIDWH